MYLQKTSAAKWIYCYQSCKYLELEQKWWWPLEKKEKKKKQHREKIRYIMWKWRNNRARRRKSMRAREKCSLGELTEREWHKGAAGRSKQSSENWERIKGKPRYFVRIRKKWRGWKWEKYVEWPWGVFHWQSKCPSDKNHKTWQKRNYIRKCGSVDLKGWSEALYQERKRSSGMTKSASKMP